MLLNLMLIWISMNYGFSSTMHISYIRSNDDFSTVIGVVLWQNLSIRFLREWLIGESSVFVQELLLRDLKRRRSKNADNDQKVSSIEKKNLHTVSWTRIPLVDEVDKFMISLIPRRSKVYWKSITCDLLTFMVLSWIELWCKQSKFSYLTEKWSNDLQRRHWKFRRKSKIPSVRIGGHLNKFIFNV